MKFWILATSIWVADAVAPALADSSSDATQEVVMSHMRAVGQQNVNAYVEATQMGAKRRCSLLLRQFLKRLDS